MYMEEGLKQIFKIKFSLKQSPKVDHWLIKPEETTVLQIASGH